MGRNGAYIKHKVGLPWLQRLLSDRPHWACHWGSEARNQLLITVCINMLQINQEEHS